jgi:hypothetical protein
MMRYFTTGLLATSLCTIGGTAAAQDSVQSRVTIERDGAPAARRILTAAPALSAVPVVDGRLDDAIWATAAPATDFVVYQPNAGEASRQRTEARVLYDERAIYVGVRMYDTSPDSIVAQLARRDNTVHSDWIYVAFDSYFDRRTAFVFGVNPRGVKVDLMLYEDRMENMSWDAIWDVATAVDSLGWTAEFRIPLSQLRFAGENGEARRWGVQFRRDIARHDEVSLWAPVPRDASGQVSLFGELHGLRGINPPRNVEILPYAVAEATRAPGSKSNPFWRRNDPGFNMGADVKYGVTSNLTLNATLNPDFGQVEADPSVVNLSAFETFLPEKRPFFVEGANIFNFGIGIGDGDLGNESLFYSRRIGRAPQGNVPGSAEYRDVPTASSIIGAAKLSGRTGDGWSIGMLNAVTGPEHGQYVMADGTRGESLVEPWTNYMVGRLLRDYDAGRGAVGAIATATNRHLDGELPFLRSAAYTGGLNTHRRLGDIELKGWLVGSHIRGDTMAIAMAQRSPARYWQRPDADHVTYDPTRTSLSGWAGAAELMKFGGGHWRYAALLNAKSPGFEANDLGYMQNSDHVFAVGFVGYDQYNPSTHLRQWNINTNHWAGWNFAGERLMFGGNVNGGLQFHNFWGAHVNMNRENAGLDVTGLRGGPALARNGTWNVNVGVYTDQRKPVRLTLNGSRNREDDTDGGSWRIGTGARLRVSNSAEVTLSPSYSEATRSSQYVQRRSVGGEPVYVLGELKQSTASLTARVNYTVSPALSLQFYAQPFVSAGRFASFMEVRDPRASRFADRLAGYTESQIAYDEKDRVYSVDRNGDGTADFSFGNPDFNFKQMRTNAVVRWEYRPGSSLYVVWSHGRTDQDPHGDFRFGRDVSDLWSAAGTNVLMVKLSYWLGL